MRIRLLAGLACHKEMTPAITAQGANRPFCSITSRNRYHGARWFLLCQLRVINLASGIVENYHQILIALVGDPPVFTAINVQQPPRH